MHAEDDYALTLSGMQTEQAFTLDDGFFANNEGRTQGGCLTAHATATPMGAETYEVRVQLKGTVAVPCDRCLAPLTLPIDTADTLSVRLGEEYDDDGDTLTAPRSTMRLPLAGVLRQLTELALPYRLCHPSGGCDPSMEGLLAQYATEEEDGTPTERTTQQ